MAILPTASNKIKGLITVLLLSAVISVYQLTDSINTKPLTQAALESEILEAIGSDADHDGLSDREESYWNTDFQNPDTDGDGFLDGEEVASGHDPTIPGPDDKITFDDTPQNITQKLSSVLVSGLYEGSLKSNSSDYERSTDQVVDEIIFQSRINSVITESVDLKKSDTTANNVAAYAKDISPILRTIATETPKNFTDILKRFDELGKQDSELGRILQKETEGLEFHISQLEKMVVPENSLIHHNKFLLTLKRIHKNYSLIQNSNDDPLQLMISLSDQTDLILKTLNESLYSYSTIYVK